MKPFRLLVLFIFIASGLCYAEPPAYLRGVIVPMVTPYSGKTNETIDFEALSTLTDYLAQSKASVLFPVSGIGQARKLTLEEKKLVFRTVLIANKKRKPIYCGTEGENLNDVLAMARYAEQGKANGLVVSTPRGITDQRKLVGYLKKVCLSVKIPIVIYDKKVALTPDSLNTLILECPNLVALKFKGLTIQQAQPFSRVAYNRIILLAGNETVLLKLMRTGVEGVVGGGANLYPQMLHDILTHFKEKEMDAASELQSKVNEGVIHLERLGVGALGIKTILRKVIGIKINITNRGDTLTPEERPGYHKKAIRFFEDLKLPPYKPSK